MSIYLEIPWEESRFLLKKYYGQLRPRGGSIFIFSGERLPFDLRVYRSSDFSYTRWLEDDAKKRISPIEKSATQFIPKPHQKEAAKKILTSYLNGSPGFLLADKTGIGKGLLETTAIPTPNGFKTMRDIAIGDTVYSNDGSRCKVIDKKHSTAKRFFKITFSDGTEIYADEDHRWLANNATENSIKHSTSTHTAKKLSKNVIEDLFALKTLLIELQRKRIGVTYSTCMAVVNNHNAQIIHDLLSQSKPVGQLGKEEVYHSQEILENVAKLLANNSADHNTVEMHVYDTLEIFNTLEKSNLTQSNYSIANTHSIQEKPRNLSVDPYIFGVWLSCADIQHGSLTTLNSKVVEHISSQYALTEKTTDTSNNAFVCTWENLNESVFEMYENEGYASTLKKIIPSSYMFSHSEQRLALLRGFVDGSSADSYSDDSSNQVVHLYHRDEQVLKEIYALICSLGWECKREIESFTDVADSGYKLSFYPNDCDKVRYIVDVEETAKLGEYYCISVDADSHVYLCSESFIPTHNTLSALLGTAVVAQKAGFGTNNKAKVLVVCPKGVIPVWRQTIQSYYVSTNFMRIMVINYNQLNKLLKPSAKAKAAKKRKTSNHYTAKEGVPLIDFDYVIFDEAHALKNYPKSDTSLAATSIAKLNKPFVAGKSPFVIYSTATPGVTPLNFAVMANWLGRLISNVDRAKTLTPADWGSFLEQQGFAVSKGKNGYNWISDPWYAKKAATPAEKAKLDAATRAVKVKKQRDVKRIRQALQKPNAPFILRSPTDIAGWPEQQYIALPLDLTAKQMVIYEQAWSAFRRWLKLNPTNNDSKSALVQQLRYRQKASILKVEPMIDNIQRFVQDGNQLFISVEFIETLEAYMKQLTSLGIDAVEISGRNVREREQKRIDFQKGKAQVALCTVTSGISLHAKEILPDGSTATANPRITILHDVRPKALESIQALGRAHRDGQNSITYIPMMSNTVEEKVVDSFIEKYSNMKIMTGANAAEVNILDQVFKSAL